MEQNETLEFTEEELNEVTVTPEILKVQQEQWINYCALWGLITYEPDSVNPQTGQPNVQDVRAMTISEFAQQVGVSRGTLYRWKKSIPNFAEKVRMRRNELFSLARESVLFNRAYLIALTSRDHKAAGEMIKMLLGHNSELQLPVQRQDIKVGGGLADLLQAGRERKVVEPNKD